MLYNGSREDREVIETTEFFLKPHGNKGRKCKFDVLIMAYDTLRRTPRTFWDITWEAVIVDEAHKLKSTKSQMRRLVAGLPQKWLLLLTGANHIRKLKHETDKKNPWLDSLFLQWEYSVGHHCMLFCA